METKKPRIKECSKNATEKLENQKQYLMQTYAITLQIFLIPTLFWCLIILQNRNHVRDLDLPIFLIFFVMSYSICGVCFFDGNKVIHKTINGPFNEAFSEINKII